MTDPDFEQLNATIHRGMRDALVERREILAMADRDYATFGGLTPTTIARVDAAKRRVTELGKLLDAAVAEKCERAARAERAVH